MTQQGLSGRMKRLVLGGALAALLAAGAAGAGVAGDPSQWGLAARSEGCPDPKNCVAAAKVQVQDFHFAKVTFTDILVSSKVSQQDFHFVMHAPTAPAVETALNFTKVEYKNSALNFTKVEYKYS